MLRISIMPRRLLLHLSLSLKTAQLSLLKILGKRVTKYLMITRIDWKMGVVACLRMMAELEKNIVPIHLMLTKVSCYGPEII